jgi:spore coat polysaccharide biosynthesis predicted glycosyltransferase SpsG
MGDVDGAPWLTSYIESVSLRHIACKANTLELEHNVADSWDWAVIDSYEIPPADISRLNQTIPCLAIVDGDTRGIDASLYLDQNLGAALDGVRKPDPARFLVGHEYALVRDAVLEQKQSTWLPRTERLKVAAFMGGTDPLGAIVDVARAIVAQRLHIDLTLVSPLAWVDEVRGVVEGNPRYRVVETTSDLPALLGAADIVVSAAGTSAWDICSMARPAILVALVANQKQSVEQLSAFGVAMTLDATPGEAGRLSDVGPMLKALVEDPKTQGSLVERCLSLFDGQGKVRVAKAMEGYRRS